MNSATTGEHLSLVKDVMVLMTVLKGKMKATVKRLIHDFSFGEQFTSNS